MKNRPLWKKKIFHGKTTHINIVLVNSKKTKGNPISMFKSLKNSILFLVLLGFSVIGFSQYEDSPLRGNRWFSVGGGLNTSDYWSWQSMLSYSKRGEGSLIQVRAAFTQELWMAPNDSCTERHNKLSEFGVLWGDGWGGKGWYVTGSVGFGFNVRQYCRRADYENEYITGLTLGVPFQVEAGLRFGKYSAVTLTGLGNWNFREPYVGALLAYTRFLKK
jgi:hypothetical protein